MRHRAPALVLTGLLALGGASACSEEDQSDVEQQVEEGGQEVEEQVDEGAEEADEDD